MSSLVIDYKLFHLGLHRGNIIEDGVWRNVLYKISSVLLQPPVCHIWNSNTNSGAVLHISYADYSNFVDRSYQYSPLILIGVGVVIFIVAFLGCCGAFIVLLVAILILQIIVGVVGYIKKNEVEVMLEKNLNSTMHSYYSNPEIRKSWDITQHENNSLPHTCCPDAPDDGSCTINQHHYTDSCFEKMKTLFNRYGAIIGGVGVGIGAAQVGTDMLRYVSISKDL
nr:unnamed protein product [Callosobruchus chinensis]